jgi:hypothetical protein
MYQSYPGYNYPKARFLSTTISIMNDLTSADDNSIHNGTNGVRHHQTQCKEKVVIVGSGNWQVRHIPTLQITHIVL